MIHRCLYCGKLGFRRQRNQGIFRRNGFLRRLFTRKKRHSTWKCLDMHACLRPRLLKAGIDPATLIKTR